MARLDTFTIALSLFAAGYYFLPSDGETGFKKSSSSVEEEEETSRLPDKLVERQLQGESFGQKCRMLFSENNFTPELASNLREWAKCDMVSALNWINQIKPFQRRRQLMNELVACSDMPSELAAALESAQINLSQFANGDRERSASTFITKLSNEQGHQFALDWIDRNLTGPQKTANRGSVIASMARLELSSAMDILNKIPLGPGRDENLRACAHAVSQNKPKEAMELLDLFSRSSDRDYTAAVIARNWYQVDGSALLDYVSTLEDKKLANSMLRPVVESAVSTDPVGAIKMANLMDDGGETVKRVVSQWSQNGPSETLTYIRSLSASEERNKIEETAIEAALGSGQYQFATDVIQTASESPHRLQMVANLMRSWARHDPNESIRWLSSMERGYAYDIATEILVQNLAAVDIDSARTWANTISNESMRKKALESLNK